MGILLEAPAGYPCSYSNGYPASRTPILILSLSCTYIFWVWVFCWKRGIGICKYQQAKYILGMGFWVCCWRRSKWGKAVRRDFAGEKRAVWRTEAFFFTRRGPKQGLHYGCEPFPLVLGRAIV